MAEPIKYLERINNRYRSLGFEPYRWSQNTTAPLASLATPLAESRISLLTSGGVSELAAQPFDADARNDLRVDSIASDCRADGFQIHDNYYDHGDAQTDINCIFPIERMRDLSRSGQIGPLPDRFFSGFMGRIYKRDAVVNQAAPALVDVLQQDRVDAIVLVPACPLDHQTVGLVARVIEEAGIATITVSTARCITKSVMPPRSLFVNFPLGNPFGRPHDWAMQTEILTAALDVLVQGHTPGMIVDYPADWGEPFTSAPKDKSLEYQLRK